jgi:hypothetical protein
VQRGLHGPCEGVRWAEANKAKPNTPALVTVLTGEQVEGEKPWDGTVLQNGGSARVDDKRWRAVGGRPGDGLPAHEARPVCGGNPTSSARVQTMRRRKRRRGRSVIGTLNVD